MTNRNFTTTFTVDQTPEVVFAAINNPREWWSEEIKGGTDEVGAVFDYHFRDIHRCKIRVTEVLPGKRVVWRVLENDFNFTKNKTEWVDTDIVFDVSRRGRKTEVRFMHKGLVPEYECYDACSEGWGVYVRSLRALITTGQGRPNVGESMTEAERVLAAG